MESETLRSRAALLTALLVLGVATVVALGYRLTTTSTGVDAGPLPATLPEGLYTLDSDGAVTLAWVGPGGRFYQEQVVEDTLVEHAFYDGADLQLWTTGNIFDPATWGNETLEPEDLTDAELARLVAEHGHGTPIETHAGPSEPVVPGGLVPVGTAAESALSAVDGGILWTANDGREHRYYDTQGVPIRVEYVGGDGDAGTLHISFDPTFTPTEALTDGDTDALRCTALGSEAVALHERYPVAGC